MFTIDASVWVNAESPAEPGQPESRALLDALFASRQRIIVPTLLPVEIAGVIARSRTDSALGARMAAVIFNIPMLQWVDLDEAFARQAADLAAAHRLRGADAVYAAVAVAHGCDLVSLDREHLTRLTAVVRTLTPADALTRLRSSKP